MAATNESDPVHTNQTDEPGDKSTGEGEWETLMGEDLLLQRLDESLPEAAPVQAQDSVLIDFVGRYAPTLDDTDGAVFHEQTDFIVTVGEKIVIPALEMGVRFLSEGGRGRVWSESKYAYGPGFRQNGTYILPANASVMYDITVKKILSQEELGKSETLIRLGRAQKDIGNDAYKNEWADGLGKERILYIYSRAARDMQTIASSDGHSEEIRQQATEIFIDCLNNKAAVQLRAKQYHDCKETTVQVLSMDPGNFKALIRAAKASLLDPASDFEEVEAAINAAAEQSKNASDADVRRLRSDFVRRKKQYDSQMKARFSKMSKSYKGDEPEEEKQLNTDSMDGELVLDDDDVSPASKGDGNSRARYTAYTLQILLTICMALYLKYATNNASNAEEL